MVAIDRSQFINCRQPHGKSFVDVRLFETDAAGCSVPTVKGLSVGFKQFPELIRALEKARVKADELGLIDQPKPEPTT